MAIDFKSPIAGTVKRFATFVVTFAIIALNKKLNLGLDDATIGILAATAIGFIFQSAANEAHQVRSDAIAAGAQAASNVTELDAAAKLLAAPVKTP